MSEIVQLYTDKSKQVKAYPKTLASEVYGDDGTTTLKEDLDNRFNEVNSQLEEHNKKNGWRLSINSFPRLNNETDDAPRFQRAIDFLQRLDTPTENRNNRGGILEIPAGDYYFSSSVYLIKSKDTAADVPFPIHIKGEVNAFEGHIGLGVCFYVKNNNPVFMVNIDEENKPSLTGNGYGHLTVENINFIVKDDDKAIATKATGFKVHMTRLILKNITCQSMYSLVEQSQHLSGIQTYSDFWILENIRFRNLRGVGIRCWYCDNLTVKGMFCEYNERGSRVIDITNSQGFDINGFCCAMNERYDDGTALDDSAMIYATSSIGTISNVYVENVKQFGCAIALVASNVIINSYSERFEGNSGIVTWSSQLQLNGCYFKAKRNVNCYDLEIKGDINNQNRIQLSNCSFADLSRNDGVVKETKRDIAYKFATNSIEKYSDDNKHIRVKWDAASSSLKIVNYTNTKEIDIGNNKEAATFEGDGMVFHSSSLYRYKKINGITSVKNVSLALDYAIKVLGDGIGGYLKIGAYKSAEGASISWTSGTDKEKIDCIISFE